MKMTTHEITLLATLLAILLVGTAVRHYRHAARAAAAAESAVKTEKLPVRPPYVQINK
jgi:hypothetical protein